MSDSPFTVGWLQEVLRNELGTEASITDLAWDEIGFGLGLMSQIFVVQIKWDTQCDTLPESLVFKIPSTKQFQTAAQRLDAGDKQKIGMQKICSWKNHQFFGTHPPPKEVKVPRSYFECEMDANHQGLLVLDDLSTRTQPTIVGGLNSTQLFEVVKAIAALHAYSLTTEAWKTERINSTFDSRWWTDNFSPMHEQIRKSVSENRELFEPWADELESFCKSEADLSFVFHLNELIGLPDVLCHGDLHAQNVIFTKDGKRLMGLFDWQAAHPGNIAEDFARLFASSLSAEVRRANTLPALRVYYDTLNTHLRKDPPFTFDQVILSYRRALKYGALRVVAAFNYQRKNPELLGEKSEDAVKEMSARFKKLVEDLVMFESDAVNNNHL